MNPSFRYSIDKGLKVSFQITSLLSYKAQVKWDFGNGEVSEERAPTLLYELPGFYTVSLTVVEDGSTEQTSQLVILPYEGIHTHLNGSIYTLIDDYIPSSISTIATKLLPTDQAKEFTEKQKKDFITKWQLYLGPLVNHKIEPDKYQDELAYEGLENQLVVELAAYDYILIGVSNLLSLTGQNLMNLAPGTQYTAGGEIGTKPKDGDTTYEEVETQAQQGDRIKKITTGPTEVEYFDETSDAYATWWRSYFNALQPGGILDQLKQNICMLAGRIEVFLPICDQKNRPKAPRVVNRRHPGPLGGPNPVAPLTNHGHLE